MLFSQGLSAGALSLDSSWAWVMGRSRRFGLGTVKLNGKPRGEGSAEEFLVSGPQGLLEHVTEVKSDQSRELHQCCPRRS